MKNISSILIACLILCNINLINAQQETAIEISPFIGDKLDRVERDYFHLFPKIKDFQEAIFYLNPDSSLNVNIIYEKDGNFRDTVLNNYKSLSRVQNQILQTITFYINDVEPIFRGKYSDVLLIDSSEIGGQFLAVRQNSVLIYGMSEESYKNKEIVLFNVNNISENDINKVTFRGKTNLSTIVFPLLGVVAGAFIGYSIGEPDPEDTFWEKFFDISIDSKKVLGLIGGMLIGGVVGLALGSIIPIEIESKTVFETPFDEKDIEGLREKSRYQDEEPYYLQIVK